MTVLKFRKKGIVKWGKASIDRNGQILVSGFEFHGVTVEEAKWLVLNKCKQAIRSAERLPVQLQ